MNERVSTPWHLWAVGAASLLWNAYGGYDYVMTNTRNSAYLKQFPPEMIDYVDSLPVWAIGAWAVGVWGAVLGSVLLLLRSRFAVHAFVASLAGLAVSTAYQAASAMPSGQPAGLMVAIWVVAVLLLIYALRMRKAAVLR